MAAVVVDRDAAAPTWLTVEEPPAKDTPGYPYIVHGVFPRFVK